MVLFIIGVLFAGAGLASASWEAVCIGIVLAVYGVTIENL